MKTNSILKQIRRARDQIAEETGMNLDRLFELARQQEQAARKRGKTVIQEPIPSVLVREDTQESYE
jgi:hypothetical protein